MMEIGGIIDISTKDIPNRVTMVVFTKGCNFKCDFCHNKYLLKNNLGKTINTKDLIKRIKNNLLVNSISITGGEPTLQNDLMEFCKEIFIMGKYISIDTNGSHPEIIEQIIPYINRVALDIKVPFDKNNLKKIIGRNFDPSLIIKTYSIINQNKKIDFEIRTTYAEELLNPKDIHLIISFLQANDFQGKYVLQQYQYSEGVGEEYKKKFHTPSHITLLNILMPYKNQNFAFDIYLRDNSVGYCKLLELLN
ncbi:MAG: anaerobic ribonucleoside-triphosphate reductase activating protein [Promethearchaeota archaeon]|nr:MAG: anaerobic ribonucleoside-triphosphate reductase activating protein [Candidatus Lokiarchaeota archaeon]